MKKTKEQLAEEEYKYSHDEFRAASHEAVVRISRKAFIKIEDYFK